MVTYLKRSRCANFWQRRDEPIIQSLLDMDFYKFTMGQLIFLLHCGVQVKFAFTNRNKTVKLANVIDIGRLREELDHVRTLRFRPSEIHYLRGTNEYTERMFVEPYLQHLVHLAPPPYELAYIDGDIAFSVYGEWADVTYWETIFLSIVNQLYYEKLLADRSDFGHDRVIAEGIQRLGEKITGIKDSPIPYTFIEFGTRRRFSAGWQRYVTTRLKEEIAPERFRGTSNTLLAMDLDLLPMGTNAHEMPSVYAGLADLATGGDPAAIRESQNVFLRDWFGLYGAPLSIALPDTFGTDAFLRNVDPAFATQWKGSRQDSGEPEAYLNKMERYYRVQGIDPNERMVVYSDALMLPAIDYLAKLTEGRMQYSFGVGTYLTNDLGLKALPIVMKAVEVNGKGLVKLSDNVAKAIGTKADIERYMEIYGYNNAYNEQPVY